MTSAESEYLSSSGNETSPLSNDLKVAVLPSDNASEWDLAVATATEVAQIESCSAKDDTTNTCASELVSLPFEQTRDGRNFFINARGTAISLVDGESRLFFGYDVHDKLIARRKVVLAKRDSKITPD